MLPQPSFWLGKRVLVTGHTGFKGTWLCHWLRALGAEVSGVSLSPKSDLDLFVTSELQNKISSHIGNICNQEWLGNKIKELQPEIVFHLAAQALVMRAYRDPVETIDVNVRGLAHLLDACRSTPTIKTVINITTDKVYANDDSQKSFRESDPLGGSDPYSASKACAEIVSESYRKSYFAKQGIGLATARAGNVIGGGDWAEDRIIPDLIRAKMAGKSLVIRNPMAVRPWQHVLEPLLGYLILAQKLQGDRTVYSRSWNFGPDVTNCVSVEKLIDVWNQIEPKQKVELAISDAEFKEAQYLSLDCSLAKQQLSWHPVLSFPDTLKLVFSWYDKFQRGTPATNLITDQIEEFSDRCRSMVKD